MYSYAIGTGIVPLWNQTGSLRIIAQVTGNMAIWFCPDHNHDFHAIHDHNHDFHVIHNYDLGLSLSYVLCIRAFIDTPFLLSLGEVCTE